jgi:hypothetical protein
MVKARIGQFQIQRILLVDPAAHRISGLAIREPLSVLPDRR